MFSLPGLVLLLVSDYLRPQEYFEFLVRIPLLHIAVALAIGGFVLDLRLGLARLRATPHLLPTILLYVWSVGTVAVFARDQLLFRAEALFIPVAVYLVVAHGIQGFRGLEAIAALLLAIGIGLALVGVEQGFGPWGCHRVGTKFGKIAYFYDGRPCPEGSRAECETDAAEPGADYECERVGLLGTQTDRGRVRYRGTLQDPNELALAVGITLPFAFAFLDRRRNVLRLILVVGSVGLIGLCTYLTRSRGGQLVFLTVLGVYFVRRVGVVRGAVLGTLLALPVLLLGGRAGAETSTMERIECWWVGLHLFTASPVFGVGFGQFTDHHYLTAHSSLILTAAELGAPGMLLFSGIVYAALKITVRALRADLPPVARTWATALLASMAGLVVGGLFLSYAYKNVMWLFLGLTGLLYQAIRRHAPTFTVPLGLRDLGLLVAVDGTVMVFLVGYTGLKMGW